MQRYGEKLIFLKWYNSIQAVKMRDILISDWYWFVINIHDYLWNCVQPNTCLWCADVDLCAPGDVVPGYVLPSKHNEREVLKYWWWVYVWTFLLFTKRNNFFLRKVKFQLSLAILSAELHTTSLINQTSGF